MIATIKEVREAIFKVNEQVTKGINQDKINVELPTREWVAILALLEDTAYSSHLVHGLEIKDSRRYNFE